MVHFSTKANTLRSIEHLVKTCKIQPQFSFTVRDLILKTNKIKKNIDQLFNDTKVIVRSSALSEDQDEVTLAGKFLSISDVIGGDNIIEASYKVANGYDDNNLDNQILIQPMVENVIMSGVLFTFDPNLGGNYYVINYDDSSGKTNSVTSGGNDKLKTYYLFKGNKSEDNNLEKLINIADELIEIFKNDRLDIEFAIDASGDIYVLQVRQLICNSDKVLKEVQTKIIEQIHDYVCKEMDHKPFLYGKNTIYGIMPDWNPAEMIGYRPKPLALSLYKYLITDKAWALQRRDYGYKNLCSYPLLVELGGVPYIDVRVSLNSFIPKEIDDELSERLVNYYLESLRNKPENHDKIEFEVVLSCYYFDINKKMEQMLDQGFSIYDINTLKRALLNLTDNIINTSDDFWVSDLKKIKILEKRRTEILKSNLDDISKVYWLLEDCVEYGTLPFAGLARTGFIAVQLLKSLVSLEIFSKEEYELYISSLNTISSTMMNDIRKLEFYQFMDKYGHLRPGTYDITSLRYDSSSVLYFDENRLIYENTPVSKFYLKEEQKVAIEKLINEHGFTCTIDQLFQFIKAGIEGREYAKFIFTKNLSDALEIISSIGKSYGISREDLSYLDINVIKRMYTSALGVSDSLLFEINQGKTSFMRNSSLQMPPLITKPNDVYGFHMPDNVPNFITLKSICGEVSTEVTNARNIQGKIVILKAADPGYDWIFTCGIIGLVTEYGGVNSHMAIRASELSIPAVIGVGNRMYSTLLNCNKLFIDCANRRIEVIQ